MKVCQPIEQTAGQIKRTRARAAHPRNGRAGRSQRRIKKQAQQLLSSQPSQSQAQTWKRWQPHMLDEASHGTGAPQMPLFSPPHNHSNIPCSLDPPMSWHFKQVVFNHQIDVPRVLNKKGHHHRLLPPSSIRTYCGGRNQTMRAHPLPGMPLPPQGSPAHRHCVPSRFVKASGTAWDFASESASHEEQNPFPQCIRLEQQPKKVARHLLEQGDHRACSVRAVERLIS